MTANGHPSSSAVQQAAEDVIIGLVEEQLGVSLPLRNNTISLSSGAKIVVDAASEDLDVVVEAYARQGRLKGAQPKKVAQDILKLALLKREHGRDETRTVVAFASHDALGSISGWLRAAADAFQVELRVVDLPADLSEAISNAQDRQKMVNIDHLADDVAVEANDATDEPA